MILLSAQPDESYFLWQLEIQISNFSLLSLDPDNIHILFSYDEGVGVNKLCLEFVEKFRDLANFFFYPDKRITKNYISSIRPHIIKQHFIRYPFLSSECIFYNDSDIVFTNKLPDFERLCNDDNWYVSNATNYLNTTYIKKFGEIVFEDMCRVIQIDKSIVENNDENAGGAQYLLKNLDSSFWGRVEIDSENLYTHLVSNIDKYAAEYEKNTGFDCHEYIPIQAWCSDMWALLWNGFKEFKVKIDPELDFCWPKSPIKCWDENKIFHNAGIIDNDRDLFFYKGDYHQLDPFYSHFDFISDKTCCVKYVQMIDEIGLKRKVNISDVTFVVFVGIDSFYEIKDLIMTLGVLNRSFKADFMVLEFGEKQNILKKLLPENVDYLFINESNSRSLNELYNDYLTQKIRTKIIVKYDFGVVIAPDQLYKAVISIRHNEADICCPHDGTVVYVSGVHKSFFNEKGDIRLLQKHINKFKRLTNRYYSGCVVYNRESFIKMGGVNKKIKSNYLLFKEIHKRASILGFKVKMGNGYLFQLNVDVPNSCSVEEKINDYKEYLSVCSMKQNELKNYISTWKC